MEATAPKLKINLLGDFLMEYEGSPVTTVTADRLQSLLTYLLLHSQAPQPRQHLAFQLWPDSNESQARTNLRNLLHLLRSHLPDADRFLDISNVAIQWRPDGDYQLDVDLFLLWRNAAAAAEEREDWQEARRFFEAAAALYKGDLLPGNYDDWLLIHREELRQQYGSTLVRLIGVLERLGDLDAALDVGQRLLREDPLNERATIMLMHIYAQRGDRSGVRRVYEQCLATLQRELGVDPSPTTKNAYDQLMHMEQPLARTAPPLASSTVIPTRRRITPPRSATVFVGRERELAQVAALLAEPHVRLLTITGPGGIGKTQFALQTAHGHAAIFDDGAAFVALASISSADLLAQTVAQSLELTLAGGSTPEEQLLTALQDRELLLVLDNFEHLMAQYQGSAIDGAALLSDILARAPSVKILVTSRERLSLQEEWIYDLQGLPIPTSDAEWQENSAVQLFLQSARRANATFSPTVQDHPAITRICQLVEGMPLGIQLAAAWTRMLAPHEIAGEIERGLAFLESSYRDVPERHRSLQAVFEHSWRLLSSQEQIVLQRLAIFRNGFDRTAAESVADANLSLLSALVDKSLVRHAGAGRYSIHEIVRQYADTALRDAGEFEATARRHLHTYLESALQLEDRLYGPLQPELLKQLEVEHDNFRAALAWGLQPAQMDQPATAQWGPTSQCRLDSIRLAAILARFWYLNGHLREGESWLQRALTAISQGDLAALSSDELCTVRARLLLGLGELRAATSGLQEAVALLEESLAIFRRLDNRRYTVFALHRLSETLIETGDFPRAKAFMAESVSLARALGDTWLIGRSLSILSSMASSLGQPDRAETLATEALTYFRREKDVGAVAYLLNILGQLAAQRGDLAGAETMLEEALTINRTVTHGQQGLAWTLRNLGMVAQRQGDMPRAAAYYRESLSIRYELRQLSGIAWAMEGLAEVATLTEQPQRAVQLWSAASTLRASVGSEIDDLGRVRYERMLADLRAALGDSQFGALWTDGSTFTLETAIGYALTIDEKKGG